MSNAEREERKRIIMRRRVRAMRDEYSMNWGTRHLDELVSRMILCLGEEGVSDFDLRMAVRMFNREVRGREKLLS